MSETENELTTNEPENTEETHVSEDTTDWKAEAKKWEKYAKQNKNAADELEQLKAERMSESERLQARAEKAEAELSRIAAENERTQSAREIAQQKEVPIELLMFCADREAMEQFADLYTKNTHVNAAPKRQVSRQIRDTDNPADNRTLFAEMMNNAL